MRMSYVEREKVINVTSVVMGLLGLAVLCLPWYDLTASSYISGFGSSSGYGGTQIGFVSAGTSYFGYGLYVLPAAAIALGVKVSEDQVPLKVKGLLLELIGVFELICLWLLQKNMENYSTEISGSGYHASSGFDPVIGVMVATGVYIATCVIGLILFIIAPRVKRSADASQQ